MRNEVCFILLLATATLEQKSCRHLNIVYLQHHPECVVSIDYNSKALQGSAVMYCDTGTAAYLATLHG